MSCGEDRITLTGCAAVATRGLAVSRSAVERIAVASTSRLRGGSMTLLPMTVRCSPVGNLRRPAVIDEAWVHADAWVEQSVRPTMATRRHAQMWAMSTAGIARSAWWRQKLDVGRAAAEMSLRQRAGLFRRHTRQIR